MDELTSADLPVEPSEELIHWTVKKLLGETRALVYRSGWYRDPLTSMRGEVVDVICSACGRTAKMPKIYAGCCSRSYSSAPFGFLDDQGAEVIHHQTTLCPCCGTPVMAVYANRIDTRYEVSRAEPLEVQSIKGRLVLIQWHVGLYVNEDAVQRIHAYPKQAFVVEEKKICCFDGLFSEPFSFKPGQWTTRYRYSDTLGKVAQVFPWAPEILWGTTAENSRLDLYLKCKGDLLPVSYLKLWLRRPAVENLLMQGAGNILAEMIVRDSISHSYYSTHCTKIPELKDVNWKEKRPAQMLGLTKDELRHAREQNWALGELELFRAIRQRGIHLDWEQDVKLIRKLGVDQLEKFMNTFPDFPVMKTVRYLLKDKKKRDAALLIDYWRMAAINGLDLTDSDIRFPQDLKAAHDTEAARQRRAHQVELDRAFEQRFQRLSWMAWEDDGLLIRPVRTQEELYQEGDKLHHCVYSYRERHAEGSTAIFLIRKQSAPDVPYFTLELDEINLNVRQNRGKCNRSRNAAVTAFEEKWLDHIRTIRYERSASA